MTSPAWRKGLLASLLLGLVGRGPPANAAPAPDDPLQDEFQTRLAQAELFVRRGWYRDAWEELLVARSTPAGQRSFVAHWMAAQVAWELLDVGAALEMAQIAARLAELPDDRERAQALVDSYLHGFGFLTIDAPYPGMTTRLQLEREGLLLDPELKRFINRMSLELRERRVLPVTIGLPVGRYLVNGEPVDVLAGQTQQLALPLAAMGARGLARLQVTRAEMAAGVGMFMGEGATGHLPSPVLQAGVTWPVGPVLLGVVVDGGFQAVLTPDDSTARLPPTWAAGVRAGWELPTGLPIALRGSLLLRHGQVPGIALNCTHPEERTRWDCTLADGPPAVDEARVHGVALAWIPGAEVALDYRQAGRSTALGAGVRVVVDQAFGGFPRSPQAVVQDDTSRVVDWQAEEVRWSAVGLRVLGGLSFAF